MKNPLFNLQKSAYYFFIIFIILQGIFAFVINSYFSSNRLYGDEVFYWFQSRAIRENFQFVNFQNTQPLLFPLILSFFNSLNLARIFNSFLIILSSIIFIFYLLENLEIQKEKVLFYISVILLLFFVSPFTIFFALSLHTEALFTLFFILALLLFPKVIRVLEIKFLIIFGLILGLAMQTRITGLFLFFYFLFYLLITRQFKLNHLISFIIAILIFLPYLSIGGLSFVEAKASPTLALEDFTLTIINRLYQGLYFWWPFLILIFLGILEIFKTNNDFGKFHFWFALSFFIFSIFIPIFFPRYWFILLPSFIIFIYFGFQKLNQLFGERVYILIPLFLGLLLLQGYTDLNNKALILPNLYYKNQYFLRLPSDCFEIKELIAVPRNENENLRQFAKISLPYFEQPVNLPLEYFFYFNSKKTYNFLVLNYVDDQYSLAINGEKIVDLKDGLWEPQLFEYRFLKDQPNTVNILVINHSNIGGIGQILICQENPYSKK